MLKRCPKVACFLMILVLTAICAAPVMFAYDPIVLKAVVVANPEDYTGPAPAQIQFTAAVFVSRYPVSVTYQWERSDGARGRQETVDITGPVQGVTTTWTLGAGGKSYQIWERLHILSPVDLVSEPGQANVNCTGNNQGFPAALQAPVQLKPMNGAVFNFYPRRTTLRWYPVNGAQSYCVQVDYYDTSWVSERGKTYILARNLTDTSYSFDFIGAQPGRWRVWAVDGNGQESPMSNWWEFRYTR